MLPPARDRHALHRAALGLRPAWRPWEAVASDDRNGICDGRRNAVVVRTSKMRCEGLSGKNEDTMPDLFDHEQIDAKVAEILEHLRANRLVWVCGPTGAGRTLVAEAIARAQNQSVYVQAPPADEPDAVVHVLAQVTSALGRPMTTRPPQTPLRDIVVALTADIAASGRPMFFRLSPTWESLTNRGEDDRDHFRERAREFLDAFRLAIEQTPTLTCVFFASSLTSEFLRASSRQPSIVSLSPPRVAPAAYDDDSRWGRYAGRFRHLREALARDDITPAPLQLRIAVGLVAIGCGTDLVASALRQHAGSPNLEPLLAMLRSALSHSPLRYGLARFARARFAIPTDIAVEIAGLRLGQEPLVKECFAYDTGHGLLRMTEGVRRAILSVVPRRRLPKDFDAHWKLALSYEQRDGVSSVGELRPETAIPWMEKLHHLAQSGILGEAKWRSNHLHSAEFYWDRARALSFDRDYVGAADLYAQCLARFPQDDYAAHYLAWNLDRADTVPEKAETNYRQAIRLNPTNRWWNTRLVTFLIRQARFRDAEQAWTESLDRLDPNGDIIQYDLHLALHVHRWVVGAWLDAGEVARARRVFSLIPETICTQHSRLEALALRLQDSEEAIALGESVYPAGMPPIERWRQPDYVPPTSPENLPLRAWYPGRVLSRDAKGVRVVVATPASDPSSRAVVESHLTNTEWNAAGGRALDESNPYIILAVYGTTQRKMFPQRSPPVPVWDEAEAEEDLRYLRVWSEA
jgi:tetratricopeptide (TPR) repeat protein